MEVSLRAPSSLTQPALASLLSVVIVLGYPANLVIGLLVAALS